MYVWSRIYARHCHGNPDLVLRDSMNKVFWRTRLLYWDHFVCRAQKALERERVAGCCIASNLNWGVLPPHWAKANDMRIVAEKKSSTYVCTSEWAELKINVDRHIFIPPHAFKLLKPKYITDLRLACTCVAFRWLNDWVITNFHTVITI